LDSFGGEFQSSGGKCHEDSLKSLELKKMPGCAGETEMTVCCNPYHWSITAASVIGNSK